MSEVLRLDREQYLDEPWLGLDWDADGRNKPTQEKPIGAYVCYNCKHLYNSKDAWEYHYLGKIAKVEGSDEVQHESCVQSLSGHVVLRAEHQSPLWLKPNQVGLHSFKSLLNLLCAQHYSLGG